MFRRMVAFVTDSDIKSSMAARIRARRNLTAAVERLGGAYRVADLIKLEPKTIYNWMGHGALNHVRAFDAVKFARAAKQPLDQFIADE